jgi:ribulose-5-phosphate 4-epimerase/fuculose-1-phosphate aldolase
MENEGKPVTQFKTEFIDDQLFNDPRLTTLKHWCAEFHRLGLAPLYSGGSYGNLSFRDRPGFNEFFITASGLKLKADLSLNCFVKVVAVDSDRQLIMAVGSQAPSSESLLHHAIYQARKEVNAIFHGHSPAILNKGEKLKLPATLREEPYGSIALVNSVLETIGRHNFIIMKNHGFLSLGKTMDEAGQQAIEVLACFNSPPDPLS